MLQILLVMVSIFSFASSARAELNGKQDMAVQDFLENLNSEEAKDYGESYQPVGTAVGDLNGDGKDEVALVWTTLGPTYWRNSLTVFYPAGSGEYSTESDSTFDLTGEAQAPSIKDGIIYIDQVIYAENDPICCPTVQKQGKYVWKDKKLMEAQ